MTAPKRAVRTIDRPTAYKTHDCLNLVRLITHWHQAHEVARRMGRDKGLVLEVGPGSGHTTWLMREWGCDVVTLDVDATTEPSVVEDIRKLPFRDGAFACALAAQVLEHLPYADFEASLAELARVSRRIVVITLPAPLVGISVLVNLPFVNPLPIALGLPYWRKHKPGEHYWELGKRGYSKRAVRRAIRRAGLKILHEFRPGATLYCYFFIAETSPGARNMLR